MKGRMKKAFTALLAATVLVGGMPVNMQANVIAETEKTESASEKVNEKYADTEELDLMIVNVRRHRQANRRNGRIRSSQSRKKQNSQTQKNSQRRQSSQTQKNSRRRQSSQTQKQNRKKQNCRKWKKKQKNGKKLQSRGTQVKSRLQRNRRPGL